MIKTKNLENLLDKNQARNLFLKYQKECRLSANFEIKNIYRHLVLSPNTYAILYEILDEGKIIKIRVNASSEETRIRAWEVMKFLKNKFSRPPFLIPNVYFYESDYNLLAYENVEGKILVNQLEDPSLEEKIKLAARWLNKLHSIDEKFTAKFPEHKIFFNFDALAKFYPALAKQGPDFIRSRQRDISKEFLPKLIHGDYQPNNIIVGNDKIVVFDFNDSRIADPSFDLAKFLTQLQVMLFRFSNAGFYQNLEKIFLENYDLNYNKKNFKIYAKIYYLQILCSLAASLADSPESQRTLPAVYQYFKALQC